MADNPLDLVRGSADGMIAEFPDQVGAISFSEPAPGLTPGFQGGLFDLFSKAGGWQDVPRGRHGGKRRRVGGKWVYKYPEGTDHQWAAEHHFAQARRSSRGAAHEEQAAIGHALRDIHVKEKDARRQKNLKAIEHLSDADLAHLFRLGGKGGKHSTDHRYHYNPSTDKGEHSVAWAPGSMGQLMGYGATREEANRDLAALVHERHGMARLMEGFDSGPGGK